MSDNENSRSNRDAKPANPLRTPRRFPSKSITAHEGLEKDDACLIKLPLKRADLNTGAATNAQSLVDHRVEEAKLIWFHRDGAFRARHKTSAAATALARIGP